MKKYIIKISQRNSKIFDMKDVRVEIRSQQMKQSQRYFLVSLLEILEILIELYQLENCEIRIRNFIEVKPQERNIRDTNNKNKMQHADHRSLRKTEK